MIDTCMLCGMMKWSIYVLYIGVEFNATSQRACSRNKKETATGH